MLITSNERAVAEMGAGVAVDVFTEAEALAFLARRMALPTPLVPGSWRASWAACRWRWRRPPR